MNWLLSKFSKLQQQWRSIFLIAPTVTFCVIALKYTGGLQLLEWALLDQFFNWRPAETVEDRLLIITVDEEDIAKVGQWPLSDALVAEVIQTIDRHNPAGIGLLFYRDLPVEPGYQTLVQVMRSTPNLIGVEKVIGEPVPPPPTLDRMTQVGIVDLLLDADSKVRRVLISYQNPQGQVQLSIGTQLALKYLENRGITPQEIDPKNKKNHIQLGKSVFQPFTAYDGGYVRTNAAGYQILLNYRGDEEKFEKISLTQLLNQNFDPAKISGRIVLIGSTATSLNELFYTPYSSRLTDMPKPSAGAIVHANVISHLLSAAIEGRPTIKVWSEFIEILWIISWSFTWTIASSAALIPDSAKNKLIIHLGQISFNIGCGNFLLFTSSYLAFLQGWWLPVIPSAIALTSSSITLKIYQSVQAARDSEKQLIQSLEYLPVGVFLYDKNYQVVYINKAAKSLIKYPQKHQIEPDQLVKFYQLYVVGTEQPYPWQNLPVIRALKGESIQVDDIEMRQNGQTLLFEAQGQPIFDNQGNILYALVTFQDITQRKQAEKLLADYNRNLEIQVAERTAALKESEQRFRQAFEYSAIGVCLVSPTGHFLQVNQALCQILGYSSDELLQRHCYDITHPEDIKEDFIAVQGLLSGKEDAFYREKKFTHHNGSIVYGLVSVSVVRDKHHQPLYLIGQVQNITERKKAEIAVRQHQAQMNAIVTNTSDGLLILDDQGKIGFANPAAGQILNQPVEELIDSEFGVPKHKTVDIYLLGELGDRRQKKTIEMKTGAYQSEGKSAYIVSLRDITEHKQSELALKQAKEVAEVANRAKSTFLAKMTHEFRTPLHAILGFTKIIQRDASLTPEHQEYLSIIRRSSQHLLELINDVLDMSKIEAGQVLLNENTVNLHQLLSTVQEMMQIKARSKNLPLIFEIGDRVPNLVKTDEQKLRQVLINLVGNAIKFTQQGETIVRVTTVDPQNLPQNLKHQASANARLCFEVEDTGPGIPPEDFEYLFQPFVQTTTGRNSQEGTGLGLAICQQFIELMGGKITAISRGKKFTPGAGIVEENHPDQNTQRLGTIFQVELPVISVEPQRLSADRWLMMTDRPAIAPAPTAPSHRILIADPVAENHRILANSLVSLNFQVKKVRNEKDLIETWSIWQPDLILIHEQIARINDFQAIRQIRQPQSDRTATFNFDRQTFMMVLITSESEDERSALFSAGANSWIHESSPTEIILQQIAKSLGVHDLYSSTRLCLNCPDLGNDKITEISVVSPNLAFPQKSGSEAILSHPQAFSQQPLSNGRQNLFDPDSLMVMPNEWIDRLYQAARSADRQWIFRLLEELYPINQPLAERLANLVHEFKIDRLIEIIKPLIK